MKTWRIVIDVLLVILGFLLIAGLGLASAGEVYKWVDKNGTMIFSEFPPPIGMQSEKLILDEATTEQAREIEQVDEVVKPVAVETPKLKERESVKRTVERRPSGAQMPEITPSAGSVRCTDSKLVSKGDSQQYVIQHCGPPTQKQQIVNALNQVIGVRLIYTYSIHGNIKTTEISYSYVDGSMHLSGN